MNREINSNFYTKRINTDNQSIMFRIPGGLTDGKEYEQVLNFLSHHGNRPGFKWIINETSVKLSGEIEFSVTELPITKKKVFRKSASIGGH